MKFDEKLNEFMIELNCSAKELANASGLSQAVISRYKNGQRTPVSDNIDKLAEGIVKLANKKNISITKNQVVSQLEL